LLWYITLKLTHVLQSTEYNFLWLMEARVSILALSINCTAYAEPSYTLSINCTAYAEPSYKVICESEVVW